MSKYKENPVKQLQSSCDRWEYIFENGCSDPFWPDGTNLNLVRNHISHYKKQIEELFPEGQRPDIYYRDTPPEVENGYVAKADEIRRRAKASLEVYMADRDYRYLKNNAGAVHPKDRAKLNVDNVLGYVSGLEKAISEDDLVAMRRHGDPKGYLSSFKSCAEKVKAALENPYQGQMNLFSLICEQEDNDDYDENEQYDDEENEEAYELE